MSEVTKDKLTEVSFQYSLNFSEVLREAGVSLAVSTYQAGRLALISPRKNDVAVELHGFERVMGVAYRPECLAVATPQQVWFLPNSNSIAASITPDEPYDACFLTRKAHVTGEIQSHELRWAGEELWMVNTLFSCLCTIDSNYSFVPRWRPHFVSALAAEDRCHLNGFTMVGNTPKYATCHAETNTPQGWHANKANSGCIVDIAANETLIRGLAMPHSPRLHGGKLWFLDSGNGRLVHLDTATGEQTTVIRLPGYTRGLALHGTLAFVGLSKIRETAVFGGVPIAEKRDQLKCGVAVVELMTGQLLATFEFQSAVEEVFDVVALPELQKPTIRGPRALEEHYSPIWVVPEEFRNW